MRLRKEQKNKSIYGLKCEINLDTIYILKVERRISMDNVRPMSDLRDNLDEIEEIVMRKNEPVFFSKENGRYGSVMMSAKKLAELLTSDNQEEKNALAMELRCGYADMDKVLDEMDREIADPNAKFYTPEEFDKMFKKRMGW
jgi:hypothetical protein